MGKITLGLLDIDGTLLLSNDAHARAFVEAGRSLGLAPGFDRIRHLIGKGGDKLIPEAFGFEHDSKLGKKLSEEKDRVFATYVPTLQPAPGARDLLSRLRKDDIQLVIATSAGKDDVTRLLEQAGVRDLIEDATSADDAESSKPDPDIIHAALRKAGKNAHSTIMIGDTPYDVEAALRAGVQIITVRCGGLWKDTDFKGSVATYDDPADILAHYEQSPFARATGSR